MACPALHYTQQLFNHQVNQIPHCCIRCNEVQFNLNLARSFIQSVSFKSCVICTPSVSNCPLLLARLSHAGTSCQCGYLTICTNYQICFTSWWIWSCQLNYTTTTRLIKPLYISWHWTPCWFTQQWCHAPVCHIGVCCTIDIHSRKLLSTTKFGIEMAPSDA